MSSPDATRREQNKSATRHALVDEAHQILTHEGLEALTAEAIATSAGVSRRTFFNYFPSVEACLAAPIAGFLDRARTELASRPKDESLLESLHVVFPAAMDLELMERLNQVAAAVDGTPMASRLTGEIWHQAEVGMIDIINERYPHENELYVVVVTAALLGALRAAQEYWVAQQGGGSDATAMTPVASPQLPDMRATLVRAMSFLDKKAH